MNDQPKEEGLLVFNGINGESGTYDLPPMTPQELAGFIRGVSPPQNLAELKYRFQSKIDAHLGVKEGVDPKRLDQAGWGVIFAHDADPAIKAALGDLLTWRQEHAGKYFKIYEGGAGYRRGKDTKAEFLARHGAGPGPADPDKVPYYLLLVGSPEEIPYRFQSQLDVQYAVGRLHFDTLEAYAHYARSVVAAETKAVKLPRQAVLFGVANDDDPATQLSTAHLIRPLHEKLQAAASGWEVTAVTREAATKSRLTHLLGGAQTPALLFTASHGLSFPLNSPQQLAHQGALLCQEWPGPEKWRGQGAIPQEFYFAGDDIDRDANLLGLIAFFFACYGAGTPLHDEFSQQAFKARTAIAPRPFLSRLPLNMLGHPSGGALAVIGHVERAWGYSFMWPSAGEQTAVFQSSLQRLLDGHPVGSAFEYFNERYAELSTVLSDELEEYEFGKPVDPYALAGMWTANNDARGYAILGDPAVRLPVIESGQKAEARPVFVSQLPPPTESGSASGSETGQPVAPSAPEAETNFVATAEADSVIGSPQTFTLSGSITLQAPGVPGQLRAFAAPGAESFSFWGGQGKDDAGEDQGTRQSLTEALKQMAQNAAQAAAKIAEDVATLEVVTYTSHDMAKVQKENMAGTADLKAITRIKADGDIEVCIPQNKESEVDQVLWAIHSDMVQQAQANRVALIKIVVDAVSWLAKV